MVGMIFINWFKVCFGFFLINMSIQVSLCVPRLIPQTLKLTII